MEKSDADTFKALVVGWCKMYRGFPPEPTTIGTYWRILKNASLAEVQAAADKWMESNNKMPMPSDLRDLVRAMRPPTPYKAQPARWEKPPPQVEKLLARYRSGDWPSPEEIAELTEKGGQDD
jgi:hypothetical protein